MSNLSNLSARALKKVAKTTNAYLKVRNASSSNRSALIAKLNSQRTKMKDAGFDSAVKYAISTVKKPYKKKPKAVRKRRRKK